MFSLATNFSRGIFTSSTQNFIFRACATKTLLRATWTYQPPTFIFNFFQQKNIIAIKPKEQTFIAIKPDGVQRKLVSPVIGKFESKGYKLVALKMIQPTKQNAKDHYSVHCEKPFFNDLVNFFSSGFYFFLFFYLFFCQKNKK